MTNFEKMVERGRILFLAHDQDKIIEKWQLDADESSIYFTYIGKDYALDRKTGIIPGLSNSGTLAIYDLLCHEGNNRSLSGNYCTLATLVSQMAVSGPSGDSNETLANELLHDVTALTKTVVSIGGRILTKGDLSFSIPVFQDIDLQIVMYKADEDFGASLQFFWDENILSYFMYETLYYVISDVVKTVT